MIENPETGALENFGIEKFRSFVPELKHLKSQTSLARTTSDMMVLLFYMVQTRWPIPLLH